MKAITSPDHLYPGLYDSHCHLFHLRQKGIDILKALREWKRQGLESLLNIVLERDQEDWLWHLELQRQTEQQQELYPRLLLATGLHPNDADGSAAGRSPAAAQTVLPQKSHKEPGKNDAASAWDAELAVLERELDIIAERAAQAAISAIGETGLDYYKSEQNSRLQHKSLEFHIRLAQQHNKVLIIHNRESDEDLLTLLCENHLPAGGIMHCFSGNPALIEPLAKMGFYFSFAGNISYKSAENLRLAARLVPLERLLIETDAPFLAPQSVRGQINHPGFIGHTLDVLAQCRNIAAEPMLEQLRSNWHRLFPVLETP